ncbi:MAG: cytochrome-c oxidase, partial [Planctomycetales bacterium 12-60-4]
MFEKKSGILLVAGVGFFALAFLSNAVVPVLMYRHLPEKTIAEVVNGNLRYQFEDLAQRYPESFTTAFGEAPKEPAAAAEWYNAKCAEALEIGHKIYVGEGCWHCHSQFVRPVSNEERRWGPVSKSWEYQNR